MNIKKQIMANQIQCSKANSISSPNPPQNNQRPRYIPAAIVKIMTHLFIFNLLNIKSLKN